jgi:hypothetical protein
MSDDENSRPEGHSEPRSKSARHSFDSRALQFPPSASRGPQETGSSIDPTPPLGMSGNLEIRNLIELKVALDRWVDYYARIQEFSDLYSKRRLSGDSVDNSFCDPLMSIKRGLSQLVHLCGILRISPHKSGEILWESTRFDRQSIVNAAVSVDRKWEDVIKIVKKEASGTVEFQVRVLEDFWSSVQDLNSQLDNWLRLPLIGPDSERVNEILETITDLSTGALHFVNRVESAKTLFLIQLETYIRRSPLRSDAGPLLIFPLMDSLFGMGKTTFARNYLSLVSRISDNLKGEIIEYPLRFVEGLVSELLRARTLHITFQPGSLFESHSRMKTLSDAIVEKMRETWGVIVPDFQNFGELFRLIPKPVFIVLDEIGAAFVCKDKNHAAEKESFYDFVSDVCTVLTRAEGVHYILCGRSDFMWDVGVRREADFPTMTNRVSPGRFQRVNLNPIRQSKISELLHHTVWRNEPLSVRLSNLYPDLDLSDIINMLYVKTAGHPRSLWECLKSENPLSEEYDSTFLLNEVKLAVRKFPNAIRHMLSNRDKIFELTEIIDPAGSRVTGEFIATRIHAGFGDNVKGTRIFITPIVEEYLIRAFFPLMEFLVSYENLLNLRHVSRTDVFEECIAKWFQSAFANRDRTCGEVMREFCPRDSILYNISWQLTAARMVDGKRILGGVNYSISDSTISVPEFAKKICKYLTNGKRDMYFPAPLSASPDLFVIPRGLGKDDKIVIGIQAKCYANQASRITKATVLKEVGKFYHIFSKARRLYTKPIRGVLIMFATCLYTACDFGQLHHGVKSFVWENEDTAKMEIEVVILNLSNPDLRREFFGLGLDVSFRDRGAQIIERIIEYSSRHPAINFKDLSPHLSSSSDE